MKKIYSVLLMMTVALMSFAQSFNVFVQGKSVKNGGVITESYESVPVTWIVPNIIGAWSLDPEIEIESATKQNITISVSDDVKDGNLQNCAFGSCVPVNNSNCPAVTNGELEGSMKSEIHFSFGSNKPQDVFLREFDVEVSNGTETIAFKVRVNVGNAPDAISSVNYISKSAEVYTISGSKMNESSVPSGKIIIRNGKKMIK